ncbi:MHYT domain-containing protein [Sphingomonas sp. XXL09]|uniref:MHYT domain-containing protein n=1 Tax=Sphingomonas sp. XXL09 TaxID=3457787 RepID=UPI00406BC290
MAAAGQYDSLLVAMSIIIAIIASFTALDLAGRVRASAGWMRIVWLGTAAVAMGGGIWAMHFVAMLAFSMPGMAVDYDVGLTLVSLLLPILVTGAAFSVVTRGQRSLRRCATAGLFMGLGVVTMHYLGMAAMRMAGSIRYDPSWIAVSVLIAIGAATVALWLAARTSRQVEKAGAAIVMGIAVAGMHFAGMRAATFTLHATPQAGQGTSASQTALAIGVLAASFLILFLSLLAAMFDRRFALAAQREAAALRASEERFRALYRGTPLPLHSLDRDGRIEQVSNAWLALLGYQRAEVVGTPFSDFLTDESAHQFREQDWPQLLEAGTLDPRDYRVVTRSGAILDVVSAMRVECDEARNFLHAVGGLTDVTERKRAEDALRQAQKIEALGQLTGGVAHDFNNLLAVIMGNLDLLRRRLPDDPRLARLVASAMEGAQRGASLTQRLLAFARKQDLKPEAVDLAELVRGMTDLLQRSLGPRVQVETRFPAGLPPVHADAHQLELALLNLAVNARDAMPEGGMLAIGAVAETVAADDPHGLAAGDYVRLTMVDQGEGMDAATLAKATDPFFTTKGVGKGTGLGLSMVHGLAEQSGGRLAIRSAPGRGTTVALYLPATKPVRTAPVVPVRDDARNVPPLEVLVVDDDSLVLANTAAMLEDLGHRVRLAASGEAALAALADNAAVDLVITDQLMPQMTGVQLASRICQQAPDLPILIVSGFAELGADAGRFPILSKPFDRASLADALAAIVGSANALIRRRSIG